MKHCSQLLTGFCFVCILFATGCAHKKQAGLWNQFRGPNASGIAEDSTPPLDLSQPKWSVEIPLGNSSPVVWKHKVFITAFIDKSLATLCYSRKSGELLWQKTISVEEFENLHDTNTPASSTPYVDEDGLYAYFGSYGLICYDHDGNQQWALEIPTPKNIYGMSTSPIIYQDKMILILDNSEQFEDSKSKKSKVIALDKTNGETIWEAARPQIGEGWSSPMIWSHDDGDELIIQGSGRLTAYDPKDGSERWWVNGMPPHTVHTPIAGEKYLYAGSAQLGGLANEKFDPEEMWKATLQFDANENNQIDEDEMKHEHFTLPFRPELPIDHPGFGFPTQFRDGIINSLDANKDKIIVKEELVKMYGFGGGSKPVIMAIQPGASGEADETHVTWSVNRNIPEIPSPLYYQGRIYMIRDGGIFACINAESGDLLYRGRINSMGQFSASPIAANGHVYFASTYGVITIMAAGDELKVVKQFDLGEEIHSTPAIVGNEFVVRTNERLYLFES